MMTTGWMLAVAGLLGSAVMAQEPQWMGSPVPVPDGAPVRFTGSVQLPTWPDRALVRVAAWDRYRLLVNGQGVSLGDTPWDGETYDVTGLLAPGPNTVEVLATSDTVAPRNCWLWMRRDLPAPGRYSGLSFRTRGALADEWIYVEVLDADGNTSGLYCAERDHRRFMLGRDGAEVLHTIDFATQRALEYRPTTSARTPCDFSRLVSVGIRLDQKDAFAAPAGQVTLSDIRLQGNQTADLSGPEGWRLERGVGEFAGSSLTAAGPGSLLLHYDFGSGTGPAVSVDLQAWRDGARVARLCSGDGWQAGGAPARVRGRPGLEDMASWTPLALAGPADRPSPPHSAAALLDFGGRDRCDVGEALTAQIRVWALGTPVPAEVQVRAESWAGEKVLRHSCPIAWDGLEGRAVFEVPALPAGLYRFTTALPGQMEPERHAALAVLEPGQTRLSSLFAALKPLPRREGRQGVDISWSDSPALLLGLRDLGVNFVDVHLGSWQLENGEYEDILAFCQAVGLRFTLNNEEANWVATSPISGGGDRFVAPEGCHRWDLTSDQLQRAAATGVFDGVVYDEGEHMQMCRNYYAKLPDAEHRKPYLAETTGMTLPQARDAFVEGARKVSTHNREAGGRMLVESVFPALWHPLADAGVTLCPKLLKEDIHPVVLALALGAAKQYGAELWFSPDMWYLDMFPGHSVERYAAALRLAHAAGVDNVYSEGIWTLCKVRGIGYEFTGHGEALRTFIAEYLPTHPRDYTYRDYQPEVAIIRFPDGDWGQTGVYWPMLYGAENLPPTAATGEWLQVWSLLTGGATDPRAVNANNTAAYPRGALRFSYPAPPVAVYDDRVGDEPLATVSTLFVCGESVSTAALQAVRRRVAAGATCFISRRLCPDDLAAQAAVTPARVAEGEGCWVVVEGFTPAALGPYHGLVPAAGECMRLRFRGRVVEVPDVTP